MKKSLYLLSIPLALSVISCANKTNSQNEIEKFFVNLRNSNYNFTFYSKSETNRARTLEVYNENVFLFRTGISEGTLYQETDAYGMIYVEGQGVQDYVLDSYGDVEVTFTEGPGKVNVPLFFAHDPNYGSDQGFSHVSLETALNLNVKTFTKEDDNLYKSTDKSIIEAISFLSNSYFSNWDKYTPPGYYLDFNKCIVWAKFVGDNLTFELQEAYTSRISVDPTKDYRSTFTIKNVGKTSNAKIEEYLRNPTPLSKKSAYTTNQAAFESAFGDVIIPFPEDDYSELLSTVEVFDSYYFSFFDSKPSSNILKSFLSLIETDTKWIYDEDYSKYMQSISYYPKVKSYAYKQHITVNVDGSPVELFDLLTFSYVEPKYLDDSDKVLRPYGYFYGEITRNSEANGIVGYDSIKNKFDEIHFTDYVPMFSNVESFNYVLSDLSELADLFTDDEAIPIVAIYQVTITNVNETELASFIEDWTDTLYENEHFSDQAGDVGPYDIDWLGQYDTDDGKYYFTILGTYETGQFEEGAYTILYFVQLENN